MRSAWAGIEAFTVTASESSPPITNILLATRKFTSVPQVTCSSTSGSAMAIERTSWNVGMSGAGADRLRRLGRLGLGGTGNATRLDLLGLGGLALDRDPWEPAEPSRQPPVPVAEQRHRRRQQHAPDQRGVDEDGHGEPEAELLDEHEAEAHEDGEDHD